jgi:signal transduction histidine kinase/CheY-like chemotaxis protein
MAVLAALITLLLGLLAFVGIWHLLQSVFATQSLQLGLLSLVILLIVAGSLQLVRRANAKRSQAQQALHAQLKRASKLESLGTMAGGVAHDFNNILAAIVGYAEMARDAAPPYSAQARHLDRVLQAALRGKTLVERILVFGRGGARAAVTFEIEAVVQEVLGMLAVSLKPGILMERRMQATGARVHGDPTQVFEAVMNLCANAVQAMPGGGTLVVSMRRVVVSELQVLSHSQLQPGPYIAIAVSDQGAGISADTMEHLFEPFFTTKSAQSGTGLGLAVVHGVMAELHGAIDVQSHAARGSCFTLYMPEATGLIPAEPARPETPRQHNCHEILVVDDEPALVDLTLQELSALGYTPTGFTNPQQALQAVQRSPTRFSAVVTDEVMPEMSGTQLAAQVLALAPRMPVLLVSGYGGALLAQRALAVGIQRVLTKPVPRAELSQAIAGLLTD